MNFLNIAGWEKLDKNSPEFSLKKQAAIVFI